MFNRETILMRGRRKKSSKSNMQTGDAEYERTQKILALKRAKKQKLNDARRIAICGTKEEIRQFRKNTKGEMDKHVAHKKIQEQKLREQDQKLIDTAVKFERQVLDVENTRREKKKEYLRTVMEENRKLMNERRRLREVEKEKEREREKNDSKVNFFERYRSFA